MRIVSLVPSLTEALFEFGLGERVVGRTRWCTEPAGEVERVETVGGTKNPDLARIVALRPDLVIVNKEENRREDCEVLVDAGLPLHVTHPATVEEAAAMLASLGEACGAGDRGRALAASCRDAIAAADARLASLPRRVRTFCPIWRRPWMTFRRATYVGDMLARAGCHNVFAEGGPGDFFEVTIDDVLAVGPELVVLPDEPFAFDARHIDELRAAGLDEARFLLLDGKDLAWYGPRIPAALGRLGEAVAAACARPD